MISEEDKKRYIEATKCNNCLEWHHHCKSECCKAIFIKIDPEELKKPGRFFIIHPQLPFRDLMYYKLHDVEYIRGVLRFRKDRIIVVGRKVLYVYNCKLLDKNLCKGHPDNKPELCKLLTLEIARLPGQPFELTDNCLFKYKSKEVIEDGKEEKN